MKKILMFSIILGVMLMSVGLVVANNQDRTVQEGTRYLIKSDNAALKVMYGVRHNFDTGFTTDLSLRQLGVLKKFGVEVEEVAIYSITARPYCGDGKCHPVLENTENCPEDCGVPDPEPDPEEPICGDGVCEGDETPETCPEDCSTEPEPERPCYPSVQTPYGIVMVNGGSGGAGITVAVLDTGVDRDHLDLKEKIINCKTFVDRTRTCEDDNGHGTHVAGTIAANGGSDGKGIFGVAPSASLMVIKVLDRRGRGYTDDIATGMRYAVDNGANIISMSLGGGESSLINSAVDYANEKGVLVIAAAGNSGPNEDTIIYPAANPGVIAVAAFDSANKIADFSSRGSNDGDWEIQAREIEFAAPGVNVESTFNNGCYAFGDGTSMATPHIAGIAARDWQEGGATVTRTYLQGLAQAYTLDTNGYDYGLSGDDIEAGFGLPIAL